MISAVVVMVSPVDSPAWRSGERLNASGMPWPSKTLYGRAGVSSRSPCVLSDTLTRRGVRGSPAGRSGDGDGAPGR